MNIIFPDPDLFDREAQLFGYSLNNVQQIVDKAVDEAKKTIPARIKPASGERYTTTHYNTAIDHALRLEWDRGFTEPLSYEDATLRASSYTLGGFFDWRIPTRSEMLSLIDDNAKCPCISSFLFPNTSLAWFWTQTDSRNVYGHKIIITFGIGDVTSVSPVDSGLHLLRMVRTVK